MKDKALITGSEGYIAFHLREKLGGEPFLADKKTGIDVADCSFYEKYRDVNPDIIYHLAAMTDVREAEKDPAQCIRDNILATFNVIRFGAKIIFTSTCLVYGENVIPTPETAELKGRGIYALSKIFSEKIIEEHCDDYVILRLSNVYGGEKSHSVVRKLRDGGRIFGTGEHTRDYVHIEDTVDALIKARDWESGTYNISTGKETSVNEIADMLGIEKRYAPAVEEVERACLDNKKAVSRGWGPPKAFKI